MSEQLLTSISNDCSMAEEMRPSADGVDAANPAVEVVERPSIQAELEIERALEDSLARMMTEIFARGVTLLCPNCSGSPGCGTPRASTEGDDQQSSGQTDILAEPPVVVQWLLDFLSGFQIQLPTKCFRILFHDYAIEPVTRIYRTIHLVEPSFIDADFMAFLVDVTERAHDMFDGIWNAAKEATLQQLEGTGADDDAQAQHLSAVTSLANRTEQAYDDFVRITTDKAFAVLEMKQESGTLRTKASGCATARAQVDARIEEKLSGFHACAATVSALLREMWPTNPTPAQLVHMRAQLEVEKAEASRDLNRLFEDLPSQMEEILEGVFHSDDE